MDGLIKKGIGKANLDFRGSLQIQECGHFCSRRIANFIVAKSRGTSNILKRASTEAENRDVCASE